MNPDDRPIIFALLTVAFSGFVLAVSNAIKEPVELNWEVIWVAVTGVFTVVLAVSTIMLWRATRAIGERTDAAFRTAERAYVKMSHKPPGLRIGHEGAGDYRLDLEVTNFGRTPAMVTDVLVKLIALPPGQLLPLAPDYRLYHNPHASLKAFLVTNDTFTFTGWWGWPILTKLIGEIRSTTDEELYVVGYVNYTDAFGNRYRSGYARKYDSWQDFWDQTDDPSREIYRHRNNLVFVTQEGYNYDICLDDAA